MSNSPDNQALCAFLDAVSQADSETRRKSMQADNLKNLWFDQESLREVEAKKSWFMKRLEHLKAAKYFAREH